MTKHDDDFWGAESEWTPATDRPKYGTQRSGPLEMVRRAWTRVLDSGVDATREHAVVSDTPVAGVPTSMTAFDDLLDDWTDVDAAVPIVPIRGSGRPNVAAETDTDTDTDTGADADLVINVVESNDYSYADDPGIVANPAMTHAAEPVAEWDDEVWIPAAIAETPRSIDPLLLKVGGVVAVLALLTPVMLSLRSSDDNDLLASIAPEPTAPVVTLLDPSTTVAPVSEAPAPTATDAQVDTTAAPATVPETTATPTTVASTTAVVSESQQLTATTTTDAAEQVEKVAAAEVVTEAAPAATTTVAPTTTAAPATTTAPTTTVAAVTTTASAADPAERVEPTCAIDYEVVAGDWWIRLSKGAGVELAELLEANGATTDTPLYPGQTICLPAGSSTPPPPPATTVATTAAPTTDSSTDSTTDSTTTTTTTTVASNPAPSGGSVEQAIRNVWPDELEERALEIAYRESRYVPTAKNFCCYGIFQIYWEVHNVWLDDYGITSADQLYDPETNARAAYALYQRAGGWGPWSL